VQSNYEKAKSNVAYQQALYEKTFLKAPFDGVIYEKNIEVGDAVSGMMLKTVFKIQSQHQRKLVLEFDQKYHNQVKVGDKFIYKLDGETKQREGVISKIYPYANKQNAKIKAEVQAKDIVVGLFGDGQIIVNGE
jgi:multidrug resistance efflux pump